MKKLLGKNDIEDALKRLDTLTTEEARMAIAETLKVTNRVDDTVNRVDDTVNRVDDTVNKVDGTVNRVDDNVTVLIDGGQTAFLFIYAFLNQDMARGERSKHSYTPFRGHRR